MSQAESWMNSEGKENGAVVLRPTPFDTGERNYVSTGGNGTKERCIKKNIPGNGFGRKKTGGRGDCPPVPG